MSRSLLRSVLELRTPITRLPPPFLLPIRAATASEVSTPTSRRFASTTQASSVNPATPPSSTPTQSSFPPAAPVADIKQAKQEIKGTKGSKPPPAAPSQPEAHASVAELLPLLRAQPGHYITVQIHGRRYLVTEGDEVRLPFKMPGVNPGDVLRLNRADVLGSRDYTLKGSPFIDEAMFECRATVLGTEAEPLRVKIKTKRRNRRAQHVKSKHKYTILRISELNIC